MHPLKAKRLEFVKKFEKTTFTKEEFEKRIKPYWPKHIRGGSSKWLINYISKIFLTSRKNKDRLLNSRELKIQPS